MESFFVRYRNPLLLVALVLVQVILLASQVGRAAPGSVGPQDHPDGHGVRLLRMWTEAGASPFERMFHWFGSGLRSEWSNYFALRGARKQNEQLKAEVERLRLEQASLAEDARQGQRLQSMLSFKQHYIGTLVPAQIIGTSGSDQSRVLYVDKGKADGIKPGMPVITPDGIVGKVRDVLANTSQILLINDQTSGAGVLLQTTRIRGVVRGNGYGQLEIVNVMPDDRIQPGEVVLASGGDQVFPRGVPVGTVEKVQHDPAHDPYVQVLVQPSANLGRLEEVLIVTSQIQAPPRTLSEDVASSEALAAQQKKAAEVLAEKLPTVKPEEVQANEMANGPDRPHQPPQPLHPDRFSVGATPPAVEMQPGARPAGSPAPAANAPEQAKAAAVRTAPAPAAGSPATVARPVARPKNPDDTAPVTVQAKARPASPTAASPTTASPTTASSTAASAKPGSASSSAPRVDASKPISLRPPASAGNASRTVPPNAATPQAVAPRARCPGHQRGRHGHACGWRNQAGQGGEEAPRSQYQFRGLRPGTVARRSAGGEALMATFSYTSRRQAIEQSFPLALMVIAPLMAIFLQAYVPLRFPRLAILDLPLIVTLYFSLARRNQIYGAFLGTGTGLLQDALTHLPLGINGICKAIVGYMAASVSMRLDVDNTATRLGLVLILTFLHSVLRFSIVRLMLNMHPAWHWGYELLRAALNTFVALLFFLALDLFRQRN